jgi:hypothetical protein
MRLVADARGHSPALSVTLACAYFSARVAKLVDARDLKLEHLVGKPPV